MQLLSGPAEVFQRRDLLDLGALMDAKIAQDVNKPTLQPPARFYLERQRNSRSGGGSSEGKLGRRKSSPPRSSPFYVGERLDEDVRTKRADRLSDEMVP